MLRTQLLRSSPLLYKPLLATCNTKASLAARTLATSAIRYNNLSSGKPNEQVKPGSEGPHRAHAPTVPLAPPVHTSATATPMTGDWVLFHPVYTPEELKSVEVLHRDARNLSDKVAVSFAKVARYLFDKVSGYKHKEIPPNSDMSVEQLRKEGYIMTKEGWLNRILFLESIAAVPGMVAATLRHLRSLRLMRRDSGWIHTLLEEAENERMHLMTFMTLKQPSIFFRALVLGAQGVFYNLFFLSYIVSPKTCHRFVGHIEEEAVITYTRCIKDIENGRFPEWASLPAPEIAKDYWRLSPNASMLDVIYAVRSDETTHRFVNHSLASLNPSVDVNPFALREPDMLMKGKKIGFERDESKEYVETVYGQLEQGRQKSQDGGNHPATS